ncbi:helix-turn-helix domain-containing protein [Halobacillus karajensis]|uniref:RapGH repressor n=1 Tax=Halobacillus karajensis TaxID=195088 RepID=A0A024P943_9BACI|nr:helix-turn-helix transcriptional regulator [Halobacillus karajensis]CDQ20994.1 RapGH repressor [Halobacillus karajensis]CDQ24942.1 RapGH repressor [Halobacillus karajensis]CDQ28697.1 RapGH repressor [Halobacillus karajensis]
MDALEFGQFLKDLRKKRGLTLTELGDLIGYSNPYLSQIENGKKGIPSPALLMKLSLVLDVRQSELLDKAGYIPKEDLKILQDAENMTKNRKWEKAEPKTYVADLYEVITGNGHVEYKGKRLDDSQKNKILTLIDTILE